MGRGDSTTSPSEITLSPRTKKVIELAIDEAAQARPRPMSAPSTCFSGSCAREGTSAPESSSLSE